MPKKQQQQQQQQLIVVIEGTAALGPYWSTIVADYLENIIRGMDGEHGKKKKSKFGISHGKPSSSVAELSLVAFNAHGSYSGFENQTGPDRSVQPVGPSTGSISGPDSPNNRFAYKFMLACCDPLERHALMNCWRTGWTRDADIFLQWLSALPFAGGGFNDAAIAEGLGEAIMMLSPPSGSQAQQNVDGQRHCILIAASNPYPLPTPVYRPKLQNLEQGENMEAQTESRLSDAEMVAKSFGQCSVSLSVICPKQLPKLRAIYNAGKRNPRATDPPVDNVKNPHFLVLISENFMEARVALSRPGTTNLAPNQSPVKLDIASVPPVSGPPSTSVPPAKNCGAILLISFVTVNGPIMNRQPISVGNIPPATVKVEPSTVGSMVSGPSFPHMPSVPRAASQVVPSLQASSPISASQEMIANNDNMQDLKPMVSMPQPLRPVGPAAANVSILNNLSQARQVMNSAALTGGTSIGLQSMGGTSMAMHMSNVISSGMASSVSAAQTVLPSGQSAITSNAGSGTLAGTAQVAQNSVPGSFTSASSNVSGTSNLGMSQPLGNLQGGVSMGQSVPGLNQGNLPGAQMVQGGMGMNQNMMSGGPGLSGMSSGTGTMIPTPGMTQQGQPGMQSLGVNNNSAANMSMSQQTSSGLQSAQSKYVKVWEASKLAIISFDMLCLCHLRSIEFLRDPVKVSSPPKFSIVSCLGNLSGQRQGQPVFITRLEGYRSASASETLAANWPPTMQIVRLISQDHMNNKQYVGKADFLVFRAMNQHGFLGQLQEKKLCAVIQLPSQTLLLSVSDKACRLIGMLFPGNRRKKVLLEPTRCYHIGLQIKSSKAYCNLGFLKPEGLHKYMCTLESSALLVVKSPFNLQGTSLVFSEREREQIWSIPKLRSLEEHSEIDRDTFRNNCFQQKHSADLLMRIHFAKENSSGGAHGVAFQPPTSSSNPQSLQSPTVPTPSPVQGPPVKPAVVRANPGKQPKPKAKDPNKRQMSMEEKHRLSVGLLSLPQEKMPQLVANWPPTMQIVRLISQDHMNKQYVGKADCLVFRAMNQHGFLGQLQEKKLEAAAPSGPYVPSPLDMLVIQLPSQTLMLSVTDKACRLIGRLFPGEGKDSSGTNKMLPHQSTDQER
ncbi:hypothetical protein TEA_003365 [Camellia sinensis var. sinensis]|uniref:Mediator of RNA polymerase II transcription subunit 25 n=1 Tax=Camellia sinensis var. sinensis TaxID=542762 RepID=A0A4S4DC64_CAMSN|nr:hypothetical protein TEA_003365 [Camellia sinensis var. sinensis]